MLSSLLLLATVLGQAAAQCRSSLTASYPAPSMAPGYESLLVANGFRRPRGIVFDSAGNLLVADTGRGIYAVTFKEDDAGCVSVESTAEVVADVDLNHGIDLSANGSTLYASSANSAYSWGYDPETKKTTSQARVLVTGMANSGHTTRTLWLSRHADGILMISRGSGPNIDEKASTLSNGISMIKAFNISNMTSPYDYARDGVVVGWGLRNSVGVTEHPADGGIWSVENSVDNIKRDNVDIHNDNPGEEMNYHGSLKNSAAAPFGGNHGYPECYAAWAPEDIPRNEGLQVGDQFAMGNAGGKVDDAECRRRVAPRITFGAHMAPLDIKFDSNGSTAWVSFHGSWNRDEPTGYKVSMVKFDPATGQPIEPSTSRTAAIDIMSNSAMDRCPLGCFRPVGLAFDSKGRLFMSSDTTGEILVITRTEDGPAEPPPPADDSSTQTGLVGRNFPCARDALAGLAMYCMFVA